MENLQIKIENFEKTGYMFYQAWTMDEPRTPDRIKIPSGEIMSIDELENLEFGEVEKRNALEYYYLLRQLPIDKRDHYDSFIDNTDIENCMVKYN